MIAYKKEQAQGRRGESEIGKQGKLYSFPDLPVLLLLYAGAVVDNVQ